MNLREFSEQFREAREQALEAEGGSANIDTAEVVIEVIEPHEEYIQIQSVYFDFDEGKIFVAGQKRGSIQKRGSMQFEVTATKISPSPSGDGTIEHLEASRSVESMDEALDTICLWVVDEEIEPYGSAPVRFTITATPSEGK